MTAIGVRFSPRSNTLRSLELSRGRLSILFPIPYFTAIVPIAARSIKFVTSIANK